MGKQRRRFVANLEQMEGRLLMSAAPQFTVKDLGVAQQVGGINSSGQVVGTTAGKAAVSTNGGPLSPIATSPYNNGFGSAINDSGNVAASIDAGFSYSNAWLYKVGESPNSVYGVTGINGSVTPVTSLAGLDWLHYNIGFANGINNSNVVVGGQMGSSPSGTPLHAFFYDGTLHDINQQDWVSSQAFAINDSNQIAGRFDSPQTGGPHAFFYDGTAHDLGTLGGTSSIARGINSSGQVVGESHLSDGEQHAFITDTNGGQIHNISLPENASSPSGAFSVNDQGHVVGWAYTDNNYHAFYYNGHSSVDLNGLIPQNSGFVIEEGIGINNSDQISAIGQDSSGQFHAFLLTPIPQPVIPTITWANPADIVYGTPISAAQLNATADVAGTFTYDVAEGTVLHAGAAQAIHATFTPTDTEHYTTATAEAFLNVTPAPLTVTANNVSRVWGQPNPTLSGTVTGLVNGDTDVATYTTTATINSPAGTYPITPALVDSNYDITLVPGTLTVTPVLTNTGVSFGAGVIRIDGTRDSGDNTEIHIDPTTGNVQVTLNGFTIQYVASSVTMIQYIGSPGGYDTFTNRTGVMSYVAASGSYNSFTSGPGVSVWQLYGIGNSIADDGGTNYVYRHGHAVTETGTGVFINMS